ncbi:MAG TPA: PQQ-binding-like beta-propeller repeat protein, partial [Pirellulales bacterium]|nr:PQQ-binding-like beta-propeller repeat protein [Pirellulales bacterium]
MIRSAPLLVLLLAACTAVSAPLGCSQADQKAAPKGAPKDDVAAPSVETPDATTSGDEAKAPEDMPAEAGASETKDAPAQEKPEQAAPKEEAEPAKDDAPEEKSATKPPKANAVASSKQPAGEAKGGDWNQWAGSPSRNNTPEGKNIATEWELGEFDDATGEWLKKNAKNVKWVSRLGSESYGNPVVAGGKVFVGTNNGGGRLKRYPATVDLGCLVCFNEADGKFLWQASSEKLPTGRVHDWHLMGICCAPLVEGDRLWYVTSRGEVVCLDTEGFRDGENDGPNKAEPNENTDEADVVWMLDMMGQLK